MKLLDKNGRPWFDRPRRAFAVPGPEMMERLKFPKRVSECRGIIVGLCFETFSVGALVWCRRAACAVVELPPHKES